VRRKAVLLICVLLMVLPLLACELGTGGGGGTVTPVPPAARVGNDAINAQRAEGLKPDCSKYATWEKCP
jgi:hypothetical protein